MRLLAVETATEACSAALYVDGEIIQRYRIAPREHASLILSMCDEVLAAGGVSRGQLDGIAFGRGPGSFTGVRIAVGVAQGIAFGIDRPVVPVSTLAAIAQGAVREREAARVLAAIDARMGEVYWGLFARAGDGLVIAQGAEAVVPPGSVAGDFRNWIGAGSGWQAYGEILKQGTGITVWDGERLPQAHDIALLGAAAFARGEHLPADRAVPVYLRDDVTHKKA